MAMCTNGSGTNSVKPPVSFWRSRVRTRWRATCTGRSTVPNMIVTFERSPTLVRDPVGFEPLVGRDLVGADDRPDLVVEDLGGGAGQRREPGVLEPVRGSRASGMPSRRAPSVTSSAVNPCTWIVGATSFTARATCEVVVAVEVGVDPALQAHLGRAAVDGFDDAPLDLLEVEQVRGARGG